MLPDFIGIGVMRGGTTWLYEVLDSHPELYLARPKELHYWNREVLKRDLDWYLAKFDRMHSKPSARFSGEITPAYSTLKPPTISAIHALVPKAKLFVILRNPVERAFSHVLLEFGTMRGQTFDEAPVGRFLRIFERARVKRRTDYARLLQGWQDAFGRDRLYVGLYDELQSDPRRHVQGICSHLGVATDWAIPAGLLDRRVHSAQPLEMPDIIRWYLARQWLEPTRLASQQLGGRLDPWVRQMEALTSRAPFSWRLRAALNRALLSLPERIAYAAYDAQRDLACAGDAPAYWQTPAAAD
jgi:hypothetical protein